jgi:hypothetical protein
MTIPFGELREHLERAAGSALGRAEGLGAIRAGAGDPPRGAVSPSRSGGGDRG